MAVNLYRTQLVLIDQHDTVRQLEYCPASIYGSVAFAVVPPNSQNVAFDIGHALSQGG